MIKLEARYLSGNDIGKRVCGESLNGSPFAGHMKSVAHHETRVTYITVAYDDMLETVLVYATSPVTITGNMLPPEPQGEPK